MEQARVSVPASSANLGPGYDCLGVALPLRNELEVVRRPGPLQVAVSGAGAGELAEDAGNLAVQAFARVWQEPLDGLAFTMQNAVPLRAGTGSSSAAIVAGLTAALALAGEPHGPADVLPRAVEIEGHPDNVAAALFGGITIALDGPRPLVRRIEPPAGLGFVLAIPDHEVETSASRDVLRAEVPRADAVFSIQRTALLVEALSSGALELLPDALEDRFHQPDRAALAPLLEPLATLAPSLGCWGATLSGAGPSVLLWAPRAHLAAIARAVAGHAPEARVEPLEPDLDGLRVATA